jgi:uncharacterized protein with HEPN domain
MMTAPLLHVIREAGEAVLTLTETLDEAEFLRSRLTRAEVRRQLCTLADTLAALGGPVQGRMPEIDWAGWRAARRGLDAGGAAQDEALWFAVRSLVPATLSWLRVYRQSHPQLFDAWG